MEITQVWCRDQSGKHPEDVQRVILSPADTQYRRPIHITAALLCLLLSAACAIPIRDKTDTLHYVVIGIGVVSIPAEQQSVAVQTAKSQILGAGISNQPGLSLSLGYATNIVTRIPDHAEDVRIEISERPGGSIVVDVDAVKISADKQITNE